MLVDRGSLWFRVLASRYGVVGGKSNGEAARLQPSGVICLLWVERAGLSIMLAALSAMGSTRFFGRTCGLGGCRWVLGLVACMTCRCLRRQQCLI